MSRRRTRPSDPTLVDGADPTLHMDTTPLVPQLSSMLFGPPTKESRAAARRAQRRDRVATARAIAVDVSLILMCLILLAILATIAWRIWNREYFV